MNKKNTKPSKETFRYAVVNIRAGKTVYIYHYGDDSIEVHLFPFRTQKLSSITLKVLDWTRSGRISSCRILFLVSSAVEHSAVNRRVVGSNHTRGARYNLSQTIKFCLGFYLY